MTNSKQNIRIVERFFSLVTEGKIFEAFSLVDESVQWWVPGTLPFSGTKTKAQYLEVVKAITKGFPTGFTLRMVSAISEADKVAAEVESEGTHVNGRPYRNKYHFLVTVKDGKMTHVKEYMDTLHLAQLIAP